MAVADNPLPDEQLVAATLAGDEQAFAKLASRIKGRVFVAARFAAHSEPSAPEQAAPHRDLEKLHAALAQLSPKEGLVITLLELEERTVREIASLTSGGAADVKVRACHARTASAAN